MSEEKDKEPFVRDAAYDVFGSAPVPYNPAAELRRTWENVRGVATRLWSGPPEKPLSSDLMEIKSLIESSGGDVSNLAGEDQGAGVGDVSKEFHVMHQTPDGAPFRITLEVSDELSDQEKLRLCQLVQIAEIQTLRERDSEYIRTRIKRIAETRYIGAAKL